MSTVYAVANQKGGVGKTTTAVNMAACIAEAGYRDAAGRPRSRSATRRSALGLPRDLEPNIYTCLLGESSSASAARPCGDRQRSTLVPSTPDLAGATVELPRHRRTPRAGCATSSQPAREPLRPDRARLPAVARPAVGQRAGRRRPRDRAGAGRVPGARGPRAVPRHARPDPARAEPAPAGRRHAADDARQPHAARAGRRARAARALPGARLPHRHTAQRAGSARRPATVAR